MLSPASQNLGAADAFFSDDNLKKISKLLVNKGFDVKDISEDNIIDLQEFLVAKRSFLLGLLENQNLLEHDAFTDLLWAVFHLTEELLHRERDKTRSMQDQEHLIGDINRAYNLLIKEWIDYMRHLEKAYPYLFSMSKRLNPFFVLRKAEIA